MARMKVRLVVDGMPKETELKVFKARMLFKATMAYDVFLGTLALIGVRLEQAATVANETCRLDEELAEVAPS